jgi:hypothetical protein
VWAGGNDHNTASAGVVPARAFIPPNPDLEETAMTKTIEMNGPTRKTLASQIDRLDEILDRLAHGLDQAVAQAVREAVGLAVQEAVQAVLTELLTNPLLREQLQRPAAARPAAPDGPAAKNGGSRGRLAALCGGVRDKLRQAAQAARWAWRLAGGRVRAALLTTAGVAAAAATCLARTSLADAARRLWDGAKALAGWAWGALRRALPAPGLSAT